jgi:hypothetical protein
MSVLVREQVPFRDLNLLERKCQELGIRCQRAPAGGHFNAEIWSRKVQADFAMWLPGWQFPVAVRNNEAIYDTHNGRWGDIKELHKVSQAYSRAAFEQFCQQESLAPLGEPTLLADGTLELQAVALG